MVDFQSRDTHRGPESDDEADDEGDAADVESETVGTAVVTVSDVRSHDDDPPAEAVVAALESAGHEVVTREVLRNTHDSVQQTLDTLVKREDVDVVVTTGGTGVAPADVTVEAMRPLIDKSLPGFGELFRRRYAEAVGRDAVATRATAGIAETTPVFCLPGDETAARIGAREFVAEQAARLARQAGGDGPADG